MNYYNEYDPKAAAWLRELIKAGQIAPGFVDERSITEVDPEYVKLFTQAHFFAGIGGWSYALRLAGWPDDRPVWTGSPPCQPFSNAGKQKGKADARHLWPVFFNLIRECRPANIFGEQVEAAIRTGWLDDLQDDLEAENYATGKIVLPACSVGAPHIRQRIWFVAERLADTNDTRPQRWARVPERANEQPVGSGSLAVGLADTNGKQNNTPDPRGFHAESCSEGRDGRLADTAGDRCQRQGQRWPAEEGREPRPESAGELSQGFERPSIDCGVANTESIGKCADESGQDSGKRQQLVGSESRGNSFYDGPVSTANAPESIWSAPDWLFCRDGKWRPVESGTFPLANGVSERVGLLRGYGNAIVPQVAAEVIKAYVATTND